MIKEKFAIVSPIRQHVQQIDDKLKKRLYQSNVKKSKSHTNVVINKNQDAKRYQRMKFMGIPIPQTAHSQRKILNADLKAIVVKISKTSHLSQTYPTTDETTSQCKHSKVRFSPEDVKLIPKIPECDYTTQHENRERLRTDKFASFSKAQPRGTDAKNLRIDKSLPWIEDELNATKAHLEGKKENKKTFASENQLDTTSPLDVQSNRKIAENPSAIKKAYNEIISSKLQIYKTPYEGAFDAPNKEESNDEENVDEKMQSTVESSSSLSSVGTYFTNDSGSFIVDLDKKIPKSRMNQHKNFQV